MTENGQRSEDGRSLPGDIAAEAGRPRAAGIDPVPGDAARSAGVPDFSPETSIPQYDAVPPPDRSEGTAETAAGLRDRVADAAGTARDRVADAAGTARDRVVDAAETARDQARDTVRKVRERTTETVDDVRDWATDRYDAQSRRAAALAERGYGKLRQGRSATEDFVTENPLLVGVVGLAAGLLLGALLPRTRQEDRALGPWADEARDHGMRYARDLTQRGREFVETALDPDNLDAAARRTGFAPDDVAGQRYEGSDLSRHRL